MFWISSIGAIYYLLILYEIQPRIDKIQRMFIPNQSEEPGDTLSEIIATGWKCSRKFIRVYSPRRKSYLERTINKSERIIAVVDY